MQMLKAALIQYFNRRLAEFTVATRNPAPGVTLVFVFNHPGLRVLHAALAGRVPNMADVRVAARALQLPSATIVPGFNPLALYRTLIRTLAGPPDATGCRYAARRSACRSLQAHRGERL